ncbi:MAG: dipeptidase [Firmicutes bacterium]|nr:dipeptidase [Bacillota bacterium]
MKVIKKEKTFDYASFNLDRLIQLVDVYAVPKEELPMAEFIKPLLAEHCVEIERDGIGNVYAIRKGDPKAPTVLLSAHQDTVLFPPQEKYYIVENGYLQLNKDLLERERYSRALRPVVLGGDDRCGIEIILSILETYDGPLNIKVILSTREEIGGEGIADAKREFFQNIDFGLILDRKNSGDIITSINRHKLCTKKLYQHVLRSGIRTNVKNLRETVGSFSDAYFISRRLKVDCVNISVGYYQPHTSHERIDLYAFNDSVRWTKEILESYSF